MHGQKSSNFEAVGELDDGLRIEVQRDAVLLSRAVVRSAEVGRVWRGCEDGVHERSLGGVGGEEPNLVFAESDGLRRNAVEHVHERRMERRGV